MLASNPGPRACHFVQVWVKVSVRVVKTVKLLWRMSIHSASPRLKTNTDHDHSHITGG
jgi:hypothetical protein